MSHFSPTCIAVAGNPNCGKSTVFNALTGLRVKVANYPGVTVEKHEGVLRLPGSGERVRVVDLPGTYSLNPRSLDERIAHDVLMGLRDDTPRPAVMVVVVDAGNLERNLFLTTQILSLGTPVVLALNMMDTVRARGWIVDTAALARELGVPVVPMVASRGEGVNELKEAIAAQLRTPGVPHDSLRLEPVVEELLRDLQQFLLQKGLASEVAARGEALRLVCSEEAASHPRFAAVRDDLAGRLTALRLRASEKGLLWYALEAEARYAANETLLKEVLRNIPVAPLAEDRVDQWLTHRVWGPVALAGVVLLVFTAIFLLAQPPMDLIRDLFGYLAGVVNHRLPAGPIQSMISGGVIAGVGGVVVFLPQIMLLFFFIALLEDSGYMARAAFIMDRLMSRVGLHGKAFIPLFSSFACAIPGIMATRTIENTRERLATILVAPLMCCSARWPVYLLLAGAVIPNERLGGVLPLPALVIGGMVILGVVAVFVAAGVCNRTLFRGETTTLVIELPPYRRPRLRLLAQVMWERSTVFVKKAGTIILAMSVILWALTNYPRRPELTADQQIQQSFAGRVGRIIEPALAPLGFDWRIGIAIISSFVAREVFVSSMGTIYGVDVTDPHKAADLQAHLRTEQDPVTGKRFFTPLRAISIMLFYVLSMQCFSTMAVVRRETGGWKWALFQWAYMTGLAWVVCFAVWQAGCRLGWG